MADRRVRSSAIVGFAVASVIAGNTTAVAQDGGIELKALPPIAKDVAAFPRIAALANEAQQRINRALDRRDAQVKGTAKDCQGGAWIRVISVSMRGPRYLALVAKDNWNCDNPHADASTLVLVYDLATGSPVNSSALLPASMIQRSALDSAGDGTRIGVIGSRVLQQFYIKAQFANGVDPDCKEVLSNPELKFVLWPDAKADGISIEPEGLPHVVAACGGEIVATVTELRNCAFSRGLWLRSRLRTRAAGTASVRDTDEACRDARLTAPLVMMRLIILEPDHIIG